MMAAWVVYCLLVSGLLGAAATLAERASRGRSWAGRWPWALALGGTVALPLWVRLSPGAPVSEGAGGLPGAYVMESLPPLVLQPVVGAGPSLDVVLLWAWGAATLALLLWLGASAARLAAATRGWRREELDGVAVLVSERTGPAALGVVRGRIVLPRWALELDGRQRRLMVLHEAEHVRARDPQLALAGLLVCALMPWNVAAWWQLRRLRLAIEMDCDARVLRRSGDLRGYGTLLLEVGQRPRARLAVGLSETRSSLERRIRMMTRTTKGQRTVRAAGLGALSALVLAVACETPGPTELGAPERDAVTLADVQREGPDLARVEGCSEPLVYVDGVPRPGGLAGVKGLEENDIQRIDLFKGRPGEGEAEAECGIVLIVTKGITAAEAERMAAALRPPAAARKTEAELMAGPTFTPMTARPRLRNTEAVTETLTATYPPLLRDAGIGGTANVWLLIGADGAVKDARINTSAGYEALDRAALKVARSMEFSPAQLNDERVPVWVALDISFDVD